MTPSKWTSLAALITIAAHLWSMRNIWRNSRCIKDLHAKAMVEYQKCRMKSQRPDFCFDGETAKIILTQQTGYDRQSFALTIFSRNEFGEYFMFKASADNQWIKHVEHNVAKTVLKAKYIPREQYQSIQRSAQP